MEFTDCFFFFFTILPVFKQVLFSRVIPHFYVFGIATVLLLVHLHLVSVKNEKKKGKMSVCLVYFVIM